MNWSSEHVYHIDHGHDGEHGEQAQRHTRHAQGHQPLRVVARRHEGGMECVAEAQNTREMPKPIRSAAVNTLLISP